MLSNFIYNVCGCTGDWKMDSFVEQSIRMLREKIGDGRVLCALSGGVDSSVAAVMLAKAVGKQLTCVFVDHGLMRKNESEEVCAVFGPATSRCSGRVRASASGATSFVMHEPAPTMAPAPMLTGATIMVSLPMNAPSPMTVACFFLPS